MLRPRSGSSNGCDRSGSECHIAGDMSVANFLYLDFILFKNITWGYKIFRIHLC